MRRAAVAASALVALQSHAHAQDNSGESDSARSMQNPERREPWPLRPDPAPELDDSGCPAGAHHPVRVGGLALRLEPRGRWTAYPVGRREPVRAPDLPRCGDGRATQAKMVYYDIVSTARLPRDCWAAGVPPGPDGPRCASTPEGLRAGRDFFALGLPGDITIHDRPARATARGDDDWLSRLTIRRRTPLGNEELRAPVPSRPDLDGGYPKYRLPRIGEGADALGPLLVECWGARWPDPIPPARIAYAQQCQVTFDAPRAGGRVRYRFPREVYNEPDWQALYLRVRRWIEERASGESLR